jgi:hypothetical protein
MAKVVEVVVRKLNILSDDDYAYLKEDDDLEIGININTMPPPSSHGHHFQEQAKVVRRSEEFIFVLEKEMPASEVKMYFLLKAKEDVVIEFLKATNHIKDCEGFISRANEVFL